MDMKSLAKSKRAHSLHHSKKQNHGKVSKAPSASSGDKKPTGKLAKDKPPQSNDSRSLPSNWERYKEDTDLGSEDTVPANSSQPTEFVVPKSKGADYAYLIAEAKAQAQASIPSDIFPSSDSIDYNFTQDFGPMLVAKGQDIFSWVTDDSFEFESKTSSKLEVPFLSLNLNALAEQLVRAKPSERLFLDPDVLPPEVLDAELRVHYGDKHDPQTSTSGPIDSGASSFVPEEGSMSMKHINKDDEISHAGRSSRGSVSSNLSAKHSVYTAAENPPAFEAASAEAELDMLLNSFSETKIFEPISVASTSSLRNRTHVATSTNLDNAIDDLLEETSDPTKLSHSRLQSTAGAPNDVSATIDPISKSKLLDDFDSWLDTI